MTADVIGVRDKCERNGIHYYMLFNPDRLIQTIKNIILENKPKIDTNKVVLDQKLGIKNMGGNFELYQMVLEEYRNENKDTLDRLEFAIREKRYDDAAQIAHKIKSSSGSIGAKSVQDAAVLLQKALNQKREDEIVPLYDRFSKLLRKLLAELK